MDVVHKNDTVSLWNDFCINDGFETKKFHPGLLKLFSTLVLE